MSISLTLNFLNHNYRTKRSQHKIEIISIFSWLFELLRLLEEFKFDTIHPTMIRLLNIIIAKDGI